MIKKVTDQEIKEWKDGRGGVRVPGDGKSLGRPPFPKDQRRKQFTAKLDPVTIQKLKALAGSMGLSQGQVIDRAIELLEGKE